MCNSIIIIKGNPSAWGFEHDQRTGELAGIMDRGWWKQELFGIFYLLPECNKLGSVEVNYICYMFQNTVNPQYYVPTFHVYSTSRGFFLVIYF